VTYAKVDSAQSLGRVVRRVRLDLALTQRELAERLDVTQRYLSELEAGKPKIADQRYFLTLSKLGIDLRAEVEDRHESDT